MRTLAVLALIAASLQANAAPPVKSNQMVPLDLVVEGTQEDIAIQGAVHVVTEVTGTSVRIHTNLLNTTGVGLTSGQTSRVSGSQSLAILDALDDFGDGDVTTIVQVVIRESYLQRMEDLKYYAEKVKYYNQLKLVFRAGLLVDAQVDLFPPPCDDGDGGGDDGSD